MVYTAGDTLSAIYYLRLPFGRIPASSWEDRRLAESDGAIKVFLPYFGMNLLVFLEEWRENAW